MKIVNNTNNNITYYIDAENRTITAKLTNCKFDVIQALNKIFNTDATYFMEKLLLRDEYISKTVCHEEDTWDEEKGKRIALTSVLEKYHRDKQRAFYYFLSYLDDIKNKIQAKAELSGVKTVKYVAEYTELIKD